MPIVTRHHKSSHHHHHHPNQTTQESSETNPSGTGTGTGTGTGSIAIAGGTTSSGISGLPSLFFRSHHTLLNASSLTNLRANTPEPSLIQPNSNHSNSGHSSATQQLLTTIKRSNSFGENFHHSNSSNFNSNLHHSNLAKHSYITHSSKHALVSDHHIHDPPRDTPVRSLVSSFSRPDFFKRAHTPSAVVNAPPSADLEISPDSSSSKSNSAPSQNASTLLATSTLIIPSSTLTTTSTITTATTTTTTNTSSSSSTPSNFRLAHSSNKSRPTPPSHSTPSTLSIRPEPGSSFSSHSHKPHSRKNDSISSINLSSLALFSAGPSSTPSTSLASSAQPPSTTMNFANTSNPKSVIRHMASTSTLASIAPFALNNFASKSDPNFGLFLGASGDSIGALALKPGDIWSQIVMRVIPLFNGEGHKGFIEDLNDFVSQHVSKTISDSPSKSTSKLTSDIIELFKTGVLSLNHKFSPESLSDDRLLVRLIEVWHFFFTGVLPYLEAIFLPMMTDEKLVSVMESKNNKLLQERLQQKHLLQQVSSTSGLPPSSTALLFRSQPTPTDKPLSEVTGIEIRKLGLLAFREALLQPLSTRLYRLFAGLYDPSFPSPVLSSDAQSEPLQSKRLQMIGLLSAAGPGPGYTEVVALARLLRSGQVESAWLRPDPQPLQGQNKDTVITSILPQGPSPSSRGRTRNRDFARRSVRRQLGRHGGSNSPSFEKSHKPGDRTSTDRTTKTVGFMEQHDESYAKLAEAHDLARPIIMSNNNKASNRKQHYNNHIILD